jgi:retrograde regulation protein 2
LIYAVQTKTGLTVELLPKEEEGRIGALGIASGYSVVRGLAIDLGGGSAQISWMIFRNGHIRLSPQGSFSFPYGAAALTRKLAELRDGKDKNEAAQALAEFRTEMMDNFLDAYRKLLVPDELVERAKSEGGFHLYLSGGGFRGWGYLLLYVNQINGKHYPISIINGFTAQKAQFEDVDVLKDVSHTAKQIFRVSDRRREQVPAVAFLIDALAESLPHGIKEVHFCQGGVREGIIFQELLPSIRREDPLEVATKHFAPISVDSIHRLLISTIPMPAKNGKKTFPESISTHVIRAFAHVLYVHQIMSKELASTAALYSTSTGLMSSTHGVSHGDRARLALLLAERYLGELPPREVDFKANLRQLLTPEEVWWTLYLGRIANLITRLYPAGIIDEIKPRIVPSAEWSNHLGKNKAKRGIHLVLSVQKVKHDPTMFKEVVEENVSTVEKVGKTKNWIGGSEGWGMAVQVDVVEEDIL